MSSPSPQQQGAPPSPQEQAHAFMANFDPELLHRVLLTDPVDYPSLTMSGRPHQSHTSTYDEFLRDEGFVPPPPPAQGVAEQITRTMKRAFHAAMVESISNRRDIEQLKAVILELHQKLRRLVPNRTDLHGTLSDDEVRGMTLSSSGGSADEVAESAAESGGQGEGGEAPETEAELTREVIDVVVPHLIKAAGALEQLESEDRSVTTRAWVQLATAVLSSSDGTMPHGMEPATFVVSSVAYLHAKADLCGSDVADFHLSHALAPRIAAHGMEYERSLFAERFGPFDAEATAPVTREWIRRTVGGCGVTREELRASEEKRVLALQAYGWVDSILFQAGGGGGHGTGDGEGPPPIRVPEVLHNDVANLRQIREATRMSVVGSALALHACAVAGVGDAVLRTDPPSAGVDRCRGRLVSAMSDRGVGSQERYERIVSDAVVELARVFKPSLGAPEEDTLVSRTKNCLQGEDAVIKLLDDRMRTVFREMMSWEPADSEKIPLSMKAGRSLSVRRGMTSGATTTYSSLFEAAAKRQFVSRGFAFYATELAMAAKTATKVINLAFVLYGEPFLDLVFLQALDEASRPHN